MSSVFIMIRKVKGSYFTVYYAAHSLFLLHSNNMLAKVICLAVLLLTPIHAGEAVTIMVIPYPQEIR